MSPCLSSLLSSCTLPFLLTGARVGRQIKPTVSERWGCLTVYKSCLLLSNPVSILRLQSHQRPAKRNHFTCWLWVTRQLEGKNLGSPLGADRKEKEAEIRNEFLASLSSLLVFKAHKWTVWCSLTALIKLVSSSRKQQRKSKIHWTRPPQQQSADRQRCFSVNVPASIDFCRSVCKSILHWKFILLILKPDSGICGILNQAANQSQGPQALHTDTESLRPHVRLRHFGLVNERKRPTSMKPSDFFLKCLSKVKQRSPSRCLLHFITQTVHRSAHCVNLTVLASL